MTATATIKPGALGISVGADPVATSTTSGGREQATLRQALYVVDATSSGGGWAITVSAAGTSGASACAAPAASAAAPLATGCALVGPNAVRVFGAVGIQGAGAEAVALSWAPGELANTTAASGGVVYTVSLVTGP